MTLLFSVLSSPKFSTLPLTSSLPHSESSHETVSLLYGSQTSLSPCTTLSPCELGRLLGDAGVLGEVHRDQGLCGNGLWHLLGMEDTEVEELNISECVYTCVRAGRYMGQRTGSGQCPLLL